MPKVSLRTLEARKDQILSAAALCFSRSGFHRTTMRDILREAELSAGAVYHYFPSKEAILREMAERDLQAAIQLINRLSPSDPEAVTQLLGLIFGDLNRIVSSGGATISISVLAEIATNKELYEQIMPFRTQLKSVACNFIERYVEEQNLNVAKENIFFMVDALFLLFNGAICSAALNEKLDYERILNLSRQFVLLTLRRSNIVPRRSTGQNLPQR